MKIAMGKKGIKGHGQGLKGEGLGLKGEGLGLKGKGPEGLWESNGKKGIMGVERSFVTGVLGAIGVEEKTGLGLPTHRAIFCNQLTFELQSECYSIPVLHVRESSWSAEITPALEMPGCTKEIVTMPGRPAQADPPLNQAKPIVDPEPAPNLQELGDPV